MQWEGSLIAIHVTDAASRPMRALEEATLVPGTGIPGDRYAERRGIPYVWFPGTEGSAGEVKDIRSGDQVIADAAAWTPPDDDLRVTVTGSAQTGLSG